jgi:pyruvate formate lyase activating enzyme
MKGLIFNIETASLNDGPGIRTTVFMKGCPLDCLWCHNPESKSNKVQVLAKKPEYQHQLQEDFAEYQINQNQEIPSIQTIELSAEQKEKYQLSGRWWTLETLLQELIRDKPFFAKSGGGVTISGGEPLLQADFVSALLRELKKQEVHTCVDTSGFAPSSQLQKVLPFADLFLYDIKAHTDELHRRFTAQDNQLIMQNLKIINQHEIPVIIRVPLASGANAVPEFLQYLIKLKKDFGVIQSIELLPYHDDYKGKPGCFGASLSESSRPLKKIDKPTQTLISDWKKALGQE